ncbi:MAG: DUF2157 domain-containing protein [Dehalococcoidia bacterium]|nr:DUF2157 domain-containing protein [Dehalococcoidia bacterium]
MERWQSRGIITPEQGREIIACYEAPGVTAPGTAAHGRLVTIVATLGSVLLGLGVILFFAANWEEMPRAGKLSLILVAIVAAYVTGYWLRYLRGYQRVGTAVVFLACLFYGSGIHLVAQVYHVELNDPSLFLYWFLGVLPMAYLIRSQVVLVLAIGLFLGAMGFRLPGWLEAVSAGEAVAVFGLYLTLGLTLYGLGKLQGLFEPTRIFARVYEAVGLLTTLGALYLLTFRTWYEGNAYRDEGIAGSLAGEFWLVFFLATALAVFLLAGTLVFRVKRGAELLALTYEAATALLLLVAVYLVVYLPTGNDVAFPVVFNVLLLLAIVGLVFAGYYRPQEAIINMALGLFALDVVTRYFELSWTLLDRSVVFIVAGALLLGVGFVLERGRRRVLSGMRRAGAVPGAIQ